MDMFISCSSRHNGLVMEKFSLSCSVDNTTDNRLSPDNRFHMDSHSCLGQTKQKTLLAISIISKKTSQLIHCYLEEAKHTCKTSPLTLFWKAVIRVIATLVCLLNSESLTYSTIQTHICCMCI